MIRCVAFDFDGTLVDSNAIKRQMAYEVVGSIAQGSAILDKIYSEQPGADRYTLFQRFAESVESVDVNPEWPVRWGLELAAEYTRCCEDAVSSCPEILDARRLIATLHERDILTTINSATPTEALRRIIARKGWGGIFSHVSGAPASKSENLGNLASATGLHPNEIVMIGDMAIDQEGALGVGCHFIALLRPDSDFKTRPDLCVSGLRQIPEIIDRLGKLEI